MAEWIITDFYTREYPDLFNIPGKFEFGMYGAAFRLEDGDLADEVNRTLELMKRNGELGDIYTRWRVWSPMQERLGILPGTHAAAELDQEKQSVLVLLLRGALVALTLTALAMPLALIAGLALALMG